MDEADVRAMQREMGQDRLTREDVNQVNRHRGGGYFGTSNSFHLNEALRSGKRPEDLNEDDRKTVEAMDRNMQPLSRDIKLTRMVGDGFFEQFGIDPSGPVSDEALKSIEGKVYENKGYSSTSYDLSQNIFKGRKFVLNIDAPAGTPALIRPGLNEAEIALARNTSLRVKGVRRGPKSWTGDDTYIVDTEVIVY